MGISLLRLNSIHLPSLFFFFFINELFIIKVLIRHKGIYTLGTDTVKLRQFLNNFFINFYFYSYVFDNRVKNSDKRSVF